MFALTMIISPTRLTISCCVLLLEAVKARSLFLHVLSALRSRELLKARAIAEGMVTLT